MQLCLLHPIVYAIDLVLIPLLTHTICLHMSDCGHVHLEHVKLLLFCL